MSDITAADRRTTAAAVSDERRKRMLAYIRDTVLDRAQVMRSCYDQSTEDKEQRYEFLRRVVALEAGAGILTHLHAEWCKGEQSKSGEVPEWLRKIASMGMATFKQGLDR